MSYRSPVLTDTCIAGLKSTSESELADFSIPSSGFTMVENDALMKAESDSDEPEPMVEDIKIDVKILN